MRSIKIAKIDKLLTEAHALGMAEVERRARAIMRKHSRCASFCMAMGSASFYDKHGEPIGEWGALDYPAYLKPFDSFIGEYDSDLRLTGTPLKIIGADGPRITDW